MCMSVFCYNGQGGCIYIWKAAAGTEGKGSGWKKGWTGAGRSWESERGAEIDFIIQRDGLLIPIEVKSADNTRAKSLKVYMDAYNPAYAIKISAKNFGFEDNKKIVPLYAAFCI